MTAVTGNRIKLGIYDTHVTIKPTLKDLAGTVINLTTADSVYFVLQKSNHRKEKEMVIDDAANGVVSVTLDVGMLKIGDNILNVRIQWDAQGVNNSYTTTTFYVEGLVV